MISVLTILLVSQGSSLWVGWRMCTGALVDKDGALFQTWGNSREFPSEFAIESMRDRVSKLAAALVDTVLEFVANMFGVSRLRSVELGL